MVTIDIPDMPQRIDNTAIKARRAEILRILIETKYGPERGNISRAAEFLGINKANFSAMLKCRTNIPDNVFTRLQALPDYTAPENIDLKGRSGVFSVALDDMGFRRARDIMSVWSEREAAMTNENITALVRFLLEDKHSQLIKQIITMKDKVELAKKKTVMPALSPKDIARGFEKPEGLKYGSDAFD